MHIKHFLTIAASLCVFTAGETYAQHTSPDAGESRRARVFEMIPPADTAGFAERAAFCRDTAVPTYIIIRSDATHVSAEVIRQVAFMDEAQRDILVENCTARPGLFWEMAIGPAL